jgi:hypothetical protein
MQHQFWPDFLVEFFRSQESKGNSRLLERRALFVGLLGAFGNIVIAHMAVKNGGKHQRFMQQSFDTLLIRLNSNDAVLGE